MGKNIWIGLLICATVTCAVVKPPTGGPEDKTPPDIGRFWPPPDSAGISGTETIEIVFTEKVDGESFKDRITLYPPVPFDKIAVKNDKLRISFSESLPDTTICVLIKSGFQDNHLVKNERNYIFYFSTSATLQPGEISGKVMFKREPDSTGVIKLTEVKGDTISNIYNYPESRIAFAGKNGDFTFRALPPDSAKFLLWAFSDKNGNGRYDAGKDFSLVFPDTILLTSNRYRIRDIEMNIIDPHEPGSLEGRVIDETGLGILPLVRLDNVIPAEKPVLTRVDTLGYFKIPKLPPGKYAYAVFVDMKADSLPGEYTDPADSTVTLREPVWTAPDTLGVMPGEEKVLTPINLKKEENGG
ncbi:MAG: Ig-like domain-containing protein [Candidatus Krumholzibacteriota bacterium]|nr:Ig-like domain-containing protein [Candidatus Krumholzibacteriota bacterium]